MAKKQKLKLLVSLKCLVFTIGVLGVDLVGEVQFMHGRDSFAGKMRILKGN